MLVKLFFELSQFRLKRIFRFLGVGILLFVFTTNRLSGQDSLLVNTTCESKSIVFFIRSEDGKQYLAPIIQEQLAELRCTKDSSHRLLNQVISLNRLAENSEDENALRQLFGYYSPRRNFSYSKEAKTIYRRISDQLNTHDLFLNIRINSLQDLIEYQFELYPVNSELNSSQNNSANFSSKQIDNLIAQTSIFIDPRKGNYKQEIANGLKQLFPASNKPPVAVFTVNGKDLESIQDGIFFCDIEQEISISASFSFDPDGIRDNLSYKWSMTEFKPDKDTIISIPPINLKQIATQPVQFPKPGKYIITLVAYDGANYSKPKSLEFRVLPIFYIESNRETFRYFYQRGIFNLDRNKEFQKILLLDYKFINVTNEDLKFKSVDRNQVIVHSDLLYTYRRYAYFDIYISDSIRSEHIPLSVVRTKPSPIPDFVWTLGVHKLVNNRIFESSQKGKAVMTFNQTEPRDWNDDRKIGLSIGHSRSNLVPLKFQTRKSFPVEIGLELTKWRLIKGSEIFWGDYDFRQTIFAPISFRLHLFRSEKKSGEPRTIPIETSFDYVSSLNSGNLFNNPLLNSPKINRYRFQVGFPLEFVNQLTGRGITFPFELSTSINKVTNEERDQVKSLFGFGYRFSMRLKTSFGFVNFGLLTKEWLWGSNTATHIRLGNGPLRLVNSVSLRFVLPAK